MDFDMERTVRSVGMLSLALVVAGCGGDAEPPPLPLPPVASEALPTPVKDKLTLVLGSLKYMAYPCLRDADGRSLSWGALDGSVPGMTPIGWSKARFHALERIYTIGDAFYFIQDAGVEQCLPPAPAGSEVFRMNSEGKISLHIPKRTADLAIPTYQYYDRPSGFFVRPDGVYTLNILSANADAAYELKISEWMSAADYHRQGPAFYRYRGPSESGVYFSHTRVTPAPKAFAEQDRVRLTVVDGPPDQARLHTPHGLVTGGDGLQYFVDNGQVRSLDAQWHMRTLNLPSLQPGDVALDLDVDAQGQVHLLAYNATSDLYSWHQLGVVGPHGQRRDFSISGYGRPNVSMAVRNGVLLLAVRDDALKEKWSAIYRVAWGAQEGQTLTQAKQVLGGAETPAVPEDYLNAPARYRLPNVRDIHFVGNDLWISVAQAVLAIEID